jgi:hypothetical protein
MQTSPRQQTRTTRWLLPAPSTPARLRYLLRLAMEIPTNHTRHLFLRPEPSVPRCSLRGRSGARRPRHARAEVGGRCAWLRAAPLLPSPPLRPASLLSSGRDGKAAPQPNWKALLVSSLLCAPSDISNGEKF